MAVSDSLHRQVAISDRFLEAYVALPHSVRTRVRSQLETLQENPAHPSLNYETIKNAGDPRMRSMRVNDNYRIIVAHPDGTGTYLLLWVDTHDNAYTWAMRHRLDDGDARLGLAVVTGASARVDTRSPAAQPTSFTHTSTPANSLLRDCTDAQLLEVDVPATLISALRQCVTEGDLLTILSALRAEVAEAVMCLALGEPVSFGERPADEASVPDEESSPPPPETAPAANSAPDPLEAALARPESGRRFVTISSVQVLEQALDYPLERWRLFLHPDQRAAVRRKFAGPALVSGGAGTGKTVVGLHRAYYLAREVFTAPDDRVLLTTFTRNLATNLSQLMDSLCTEPEVRARIEVAHVHSLAAQLRHQAGERFGILDDKRATAEMSKVVAEHDTLGLSPAFYLAEWREVVQEREVLDEAAYLQVERVGRGRPLNRRQRAAIWTVLAAYGEALRAIRYEDWPTTLRRVCELLTSGQLTPPARYRAAIVDEAQDMGAPEMRLLLALVGQGPESLLLLGDTRQQIYARGSYVPLLKIGIGRRHIQLRVNYRTTEQIRSAATTVLREPESLTGERLRRNDGISLLSGPPPTVRAFSSIADEIAALSAAINETLTDMAPEDVAVVARTNSQVTYYTQALMTAGITAVKLLADGAPGPGVRVATMHRVKGLEFRAVFLVGCSADVLPQPFKGEDDAAARADHEERERHLLYVAMTRAREVLWISGPGELSPLLR